MNYGDKVNFLYGCNDRVIQATVIQNLKNSVQLITADGDVRIMPPARCNVVKQSGVQASMGQSWARGRKRPSGAIHIIVDGAPVCGVDAELHTVSSFSAPFGVNCKNCLKKA